ncbi:hypothetical protein FQA39_LY13177 [Lamprigera yunnana]|nr:hypothetical protein FQA39_LY13177 [Lamprigera yunnana]
MITVRKGPNGELEIFKPIKTPRYLCGQVTTTKLTLDLKVFNNHRYTIFHAQPLIDDKPPQYDIIKLSKVSKLQADASRVGRIDRENRKLLKRINRINRTKGLVDCYNPHVYGYRSQWKYHEAKMRRLVEDNRKTYKALCQTKSRYQTEDFEKFWNYNKKKMNRISVFPLVLFDKKPIDYHVQRQPSISNCECSCFIMERPKCFMDFRIQDGVFLGRIVIELYHDYVPVTVQNFISICCNQDGLTYKNCKIHRIAPGLYIETGDITKGNGKGGYSIYGPTFAEENHVLKHVRMGVLSMVPVQPCTNNSQFSITLQAMECFDHSRVAFGKVIIGNNTLCKLNDLGKKYGPPSSTIIIHRCGKYIKGVTPGVIKNFKYYKNSVANC